MIYVALTMASWLATGLTGSCTCDEAKLHHEWCGECGKGYVAGDAARSRGGRSAARGVAASALRALPGACAAPSGADKSL